MGRSRIETGKPWVEADGLIVVLDRFLILTQPRIGTAPVVVDCVGSSKLRVEPESVVV